MTRRGGQSPLRRARLPRFSGNTILIATEGEKTEPIYLNGLRDHLELSAAQIEVVHPPATDPIRLVEHAIERKKQADREKRKGRGVGFDEVRVVFDREAIHDERDLAVPKALRKAEAKGIRVALSNPGFEFWILLHFTKTTKHFADVPQVIKTLKKTHWRDYEKGRQPSSSLIGRIPAAVTSAQFCRKHHEECSGDGNPSTDMDLLVRSMNEATREHLRLALPAKESF